MSHTSLIVREDALSSLVLANRRVSSERASSMADYGQQLRVQWTAVTSLARSHPASEHTSRRPDATSLSFPFARPRLLGTEDPTGLPRRNMLARTSDTLGLAVCRAVPITPRRIPSACYLSLGTCAGDIMWESKRIRRYTRYARQNSAGDAPMLRRRIPGESRVKSLRLNGTSFLRLLQFQMLSTFAWNIF